MIQLDTSSQPLYQSELPFFKNSLRAVLSQTGLLELIFQARPPKSNIPVQDSLLQPLRAYLAGEASSFTWPIDWEQLRGTPFQKKVWRILCQIPSGQIASYTDVAKAVGSPQGARAVGVACAQNPILLVIPCHRVIAKGHWGGYSGGGLEVKKSLLRLEGHSL